MVILDVSAAAFEEIKQRLLACGQAERIGKANGVEAIDLSDLAIKSETDERVKVFIMFNGRRVAVKQPPSPPPNETVRKGV